MKKRIISSAIILSVTLSQMSNVFGAGLIKNSVNDGGGQDKVTAEEAKQQLFKEAEGYSDRYIVKYKTASVPEEDRLEECLQSAFAEAQEKKVVLKDAADAQIKDDEERQEFARILESGVSVVSDEGITEPKVEKASDEYEVIKLPEKVAAEVFMEEFLEDAGKEIAYMQPDYIVNLASEAEEVYQPVQDSEYVQAEEKVSVPQESILERETDMQEAWKYSKGAGVTVALLDTGVDTSHPDLQGHMLAGYDFINDRAEVYDDKLGMEQAHGTHIAGIIAQTAPEAKILPLKVFENGNAYTSDILQAISFAEQQGASIVNMSFGSTDNNQALREAMEASEMFFVCAAGNHRKDLGETPIYPAAFGLENSISVAALNQDLGIAYFSNYGEAVDIAAWGRDVYSCFPEGEHGEMDGTSMAAGYVSAAAALSAASGAEGLKNRLKDTADKITCLDGKVSDGNKLSFSGAVSDVVKDGMIEVTPEEDLDEAYELMSPQEKWELFNTKKNIAIAAGGSQALALKEDGTVWAWGYTGIGGPACTPEDCSYEPLKVVGLENIVAISAGFEHCLALKDDGTVYAWGANSDGQLGNGTTTGSRIPVRAPEGYVYGKVKGISAGQNHSLAVTETGQILAWGANEYGQLGDASYYRKTIPTTLPYVYNIVEVSAGNGESMALDKDGNVLVWGKNAPENLSNGISYIIPQQMNFEQKVKKLSTGIGYNRAIITEQNGAVWGWGKGYLGDGSTNSSGAQGLHQIVESDNSILKNITQISIGRYSTFALRSDGVVCGWGENKYGELARSKGAVSKATMITYGIKAVAVGDDFSLMLHNDGTVFASGSNGCGQCGQRQSIKECLYPTEIVIGENLSFNNAESMVLNETINGELVNNHECRYYSFVPSKSGVYSFEGLTNYDFYGELYNADKKRIAFNDNGNGAGESTNKLDFYFKYQLSAGQTYYLMVCSQGANYSGPFAVKVKLKYLDDYGNTMEDAENIQTGDDKYCAIDYEEDIDMFRFVPARTATYTFETISSFDTYGILYDASGVEIAHNDNGNAQGVSTNRRDFYIKHPLVANQVYYIAVTCEFAVGYSLKVMESRDEYGEQISSAFDISEQYMTEGEINYIGDTDTFVFIPKTDETYIFTTRGDTNLEGTLLTVNSDSNIISESPLHVDNNLKFEVDLKANETRYLLLHNRDTSISSLGTYQIYVETPLTVTIE